MSNSNELQTFNFNSHALRVITDEHGEPWFIAKDVANILGYSDAHKMTSRLDNDEVQNRQIRGSGFNNKGTLIINESGLYSSILGSNKPEAKVFKKHVTSEILPTIRKTGSYSVQPNHPTPEQRAPLLNVITRLSSISEELADLTKTVMEGNYIAKGEPEQEPTLSMPDYFPLLVFSKATLEHLAEKVDNAIKIKTAEERKKLIAKIHVLAKELAKKSNIGVRFYDLEARKKELPVQYRNPENPSQTWRGRGIMPLWLQDKIANGHQKEDFKETSKEHDNV